MSQNFAIQFSMKKIKIEFGALSIPFLLLCLSFGLLSDVFGSTPTCKNLFDKINDEPLVKKVNLYGANFLHQRQQNLHRSGPVNWTFQKMNKNGDQNSMKANEKIDAWLKTLERLQERHQDPVLLQRVIESYYRKHVVKFEDIPDSYYLNQQKIARNLGYKTPELVLEVKEKMAEILIQDQKQSLKNWIEYFYSKDSSHYPLWLKYWMFHGMLKLGKYDPEAGKFQSRSADNVSLFADLNREALAIVADSFINKFNNVSLSGVSASRMNELLNDSSFGKLYGRAIQSLGKVRLSSTSVSGIWVKYDRGSDPSVLVNSLKGMNTGWCTAGYSVAREQLEKGDFHVYYSQDEKGEARIPRIAIRMEGEDIGEIRGVAKDQNIDSGIAKSSVLNDKLEQFGSREKKYYKKVADMKLLTEIEKKHNEGQDLEISEIKFLYEIESPIDGFGYQKDPRIQEIISKRNIRHDLSKAYHVKASEVSLTKEEFLRFKTKIHYGNLEFIFEKDSKLLLRIGKLVLPEVVVGSVAFDGFYSLNDVVFPHRLKSLHINLKQDYLLPGMKLNLENVSAYEVSIKGVSSADNITWPKSVRRLIAEIESSGKGFDLGHLEVDFLQFYHLKTLKGVILPKSIHDLYLNSLESGLGLNLKNYIMDTLNLAKLKTLDGVVLPKRFRTLELYSLEKGNGLDLSQQDMESLALNKLTNMYGVILPKSLINLNMESLIDGNGLDLGNYKMGIVKLLQLKSMEGFTPPLSVQDLFLNALEEGKGLNLSNKEMRHLSLPRLKNLKDVILPASAQSISLAGLEVPGLIKEPVLSADLFQALTGAKLPLKLKTIEILDKWYDKNTIKYP